MVIKSVLSSASFLEDSSFSFLSASCTKVRYSDLRGFSLVVVFRDLNWIGSTG